MNRTEIEREHWVERYLAGRLSEADARQFEAYWVENPEVMRELEACARLKGGLAGLRARGELDALVRPASWWPGRFRLLALAACAVFAVVGLATWRSLQAPRAVQLAAAAAVASLPGHAALVAGERFTLLRLRSAASVDATIELPPQPAALELRVMPEVPAAASGNAAGPQRYVATLAAENVADGRPLPSPASVRGLTAGADGYVALFLDSGTLAPGHYRLRVEPMSATASIPASAAAGAADYGAGFAIDVRGSGGRLP